MIVLEEERERRETFYSIILLALIVFSIIYFTA